MAINEDSEDPDNLSEMSDLGDLMSIHSLSKLQSLDTFVGAASSPIHAIDPLIQQILDGRYLIERNLATNDDDNSHSADKGGIGVVYLAKDLKNISRPVVVKILKTEVLQENKDVLRKFQHEREALLRFDHPNIVGLLDSGALPDGNPYLVMPFIQGHSLRHVLNEANGNLNFSFCAHIIEAVTDALAAAHAEKILHRDIKPENVMLTPQVNGKEHVRLIDFGIARVTNSKVAPMTEVQQASGTVFYMAPEQLRGELTQTFAVDVYSCAVMFYEMLTRELPFRPKSIVEMGELQKNGVQTLPSTLRSDIPPAAEKILVQALAYEPTARPQEIGQFGKELATILRQGVLPESDSGNALNQLFRDKNNFAQASLAIDQEPKAPSRQIEQHKTQKITTIVGGFSFQTLLNKTALSFASQPQTGINWQKIVISVVGALTILVLLGIGAFIAWKSVQPEKEEIITDSSSSPVFNQPAEETGNKRLSYFLEVQKSRGAVPYEESSRTAGEEIFESGDKFKVSLISNAKGLLYIFNESKDEKGKPVYHILFPTPKRNNGSADVDKNVAVETGTNTFAGGKGTETIWIVWSSKPQADLENVRQIAFDNQGTIKDNSGIQQLAIFLQEHGAQDLEIIKDKSNNRSIINSRADIIAYRMKLEHH
jgi:serine/threonine protein kinase